MSPCVIYKLAIEHYVKPFLKVCILYYLNHTNNITKESAKVKFYFHFFHFFCILSL
jgi:hypothetical protein